MQLIHYAKKSSHHMLFYSFDDSDNCQGYWLRGSKCGGQSVNVHPVQTCLDNGFSV